MPLRRTSTSAWLRTVGAVALTALLLSPSVALAQGKKGRDEPAKEERGYTVPYVFTLVCVALGVIVACLPTQRQKGDFDKDLA